MEDLAGLQRLLFSFNSSQQITSSDIKHGTVFYGQRILLHFPFDQNATQKIKDGVLNRNVEKKKRFFKNIAIKKKKLAIEKTAKNCNESTFDTAGHTYSIIKIRKHHHDDSIDRHHG